MLKKKSTIISIACCCVMLLFFGFATADDTLLSPQDAQAMILANKDNPQFIILDVRAREHFEQGHIEGARAINYYATNFARLVGQLDREATILIYCQRGRQSPLALRAMSRMHFEKMYVLDGGFLAWVEAGLPVER